MHSIGSSVLVVVDMQNGFVVPDAQQLVPTVSALIDRWQGFGGTTLFTRFINEVNSQYERLTNWTQMRTSPAIDIIPELATMADVVVDKTTYTFVTSEVRKLIDRHNWRTFVFCGVDTDACVLKSAIDIFELGFTPLVLEDACFSCAGEDMHINGLKVLRRSIGDRQVISIETVFDQFGL